MSIDLKHWLLQDQYFVDQAALLLAGIEPARAERAFNRKKKEQEELFNEDEKKSKTFKDLGLPYGPDGLVIVAEECDVEGWEKARTYYTALFIHINRDIEDPCFENLKVIVSQESVKEWAQSKGLDFPCGCPIEQQCIPTEVSLNQILDPNHDCYSEDLAIAIQLWGRLATMEDKPEHIVKEAKAILKKEYELDETEALRIARVISWQNNKQKDTKLDPAKVDTLHVS